MKIKLYINDEGKWQAEWDSGAVVSYVVLPHGRVTIEQLSNIEAFERKVSDLEKVRDKLQNELKELRTKASRI